MPREAKCDGASLNLLCDQCEALSTTLWERLDKDEVAKLKTPPPLTERFASNVQDQAMKCLGLAWNCLIRLYNLDQTPGLNAAIPSQPGLTGQLDTFWVLCSLLIW